MKEVCIKKVLESAGRFEEVKKEIESFINETYGNYPVGLYIDDEGKVSYDVMGKETRNEASAILELISSDITTLADIPYFFNFTKYANYESNIMLHNYANAVAHRNSELNIPDMEKIRVWLIIDNLLACVACGIAEEHNSWTIPCGWKKL